MQKSSSYCTKDVSSQVAAQRKEPWRSSSFGSITTGCCYSIDYNEDCDDFYRPARISYSFSNQEEPIDEELGLIEDHFSRPEGFFGFSTTEELEMAIKNCKEMILQIPEKTEKRKQLVKKLVQLRLKYQEVKESPETPPEVNIVLGHNFELGDGEKLQQYCEKCCNIIWGVFHKWYRCKYCGFKCHNKCINLITRVCAHTKVQENPFFILDICPEVPLSEQKYRCAECKRKFIFKIKVECPLCKEIKNSLWNFCGNELRISFEEDGECFPRVCDYNGLSYCSFCHWNSSAVIPARVVHNWDFTPRKVCRASIQFLRIMSKKPIFNIESLNPALFGFVTELSIIKKLRNDILLMKRYFLTCHAASEEKLLLQLRDRQHFVENADFYSLKDLIDVQSGQLMSYLENVCSTFIQHITEKCQGCRGKGFICELCNADEILFPFYLHTDSCSKCNSLFHQGCFLNSEGFCPKCARKAKQNMEEKLT